MIIMEAVLLSLHVVLPPFVLHFQVLIGLLFLKEAKTFSTATSN